MRTLRGTKPTFTICANPNLNIFVSRTDDGRDVIMRQPRRGDSTKSRTAYRDFTEESLRRWRRKYVDQKIYDPKQRCMMPLYRGEVPGVMPLIVEVEGDIVAFADAFFRLGKTFPSFNVKPDDRCINCGIVVLDKYQGMGVGHYYPLLTDEIGRYFKCDWILGTTYVHDGLHNIRKYDNWETLRFHNGMVDHRKSLKIEEKAS